MTPPKFLPARAAFSGPSAQQKSPTNFHRAANQSDQNKFPEVCASILRKHRG